MIKRTIPKGWDEKKIKRVIAYYERQSAEEALAEDEAAYSAKSQAMMEVPVKLVPLVREIIARHKSSMRAKVHAQQRHK
ncbi:MAG: hypothetical protein HY884_02420 [Deltaproteobacteria bacterium]|nr:hypothetical protein [Deltaproteobacteria bacterium]